MESKMADTFTSKNVHIDKAPKRIELLGDKTKRPEPAQHIIEFPGGAIELSRTSDGCYWAHILINRKQAVADMDGFHHCLGRVIDSRVGRRGETYIDQIDEQREVEQIAVLIEPVR